MREIVGQMDALHVLAQFRVKRRGADRKGSPVEWRSAKDGRLNLFSLTFLEWTLNASTSAETSSNALATALNS
jgi:hypothetical protein